MMLDTAIVVGITGLCGLVVAAIMTVLAGRREQRRVWKLAHRDHSGWDAQGQPWPRYEGNGEGDAPGPSKPGLEYLEYLEFLRATEQFRRKIREDQAQDSA